jgi:hypothetical protein
MRDSINASSIPVAGTEIAAGYIDGRFNDWSALAARFPNINRVSIDVNGSNPGASVRDWETGDKAGNLEQWVVDHNTRTGKKDAVVYCNRSTIAEVRQLTGSQILNKDYYLWIATLDGTIYGPSNLAGVIACQYETVNGAYDQSDVWETPAVSWTVPRKPAVDPAPVPLPGIPTNLQATSVVSAVTLSASWEGTASRLSAAPWEFQLELLTSKGWQLVQQQNLAATSIRIAVAPNSTYRYRVSGGNWSEWVTITTP